MLAGGSLLRGGEDDTRPANLILASLPKDEYDRVCPLLEPCVLGAHETLQEAGELADYVHFPTKGIISALSALGEGTTVEFATIGREGTTGVQLFLGMSSPNVSLVSPVPGESLRMHSKDFSQQARRNVAFAGSMTRYSGLMLALASQSAACNRAHQVDARCARWLLMAQNRVGEPSFPMTQEFLSLILGVSRPSVAMAAESLQRQGCISYHRGTMVVLKRERLRRIACECYEMMMGAVREFEDYCAAVARGDSIA